MRETKEIESETLINEVRSEDDGKNTHIGALDQTADSTHAENCSRGTTWTHRNDTYFGIIVKLKTGGGVGGGGGGW